MDTPIKLTFELTSPVVASGFPIHLDALLAYAVTQQKLGRLISGRRTVPDVLLRELAADLPLAKESKEGEWVWKASALVAEEVLDRSIRMWTRKTNAADLADRIGKREVLASSRAMTFLSKGLPFAINVSKLTGVPTDRIDYYPVETVRRLHAWCVGDIDQIESLLSPESGFLTNIGKLARIGHGNVSSVSVEEDEAAFEKWKKRVLPWEEAGYEPIQAAFRPPYWAAENKGLAFIPDDL